jgi:hypothetical protein
MPQHTFLKVDKKEICFLSPNCRTVGTPAEIWARRLALFRMPAPVLWGFGDLKSLEASVHESAPSAPTMRHSRSALKRQYFANRLFNFRTRRFVLRG